MPSVQRTNLGPYQPLEAPYDAKCSFRIDAIHAPRSIISSEANHALTFNLDNSSGAAHCHPTALIARPAHLNRFCSDSAPSWQFNIKGCSIAQLARVVNSAIMTFNDPFGNAQPEPGALEFAVIL
jgi:hypothetical protein